MRPLVHRLRGAFRSTMMTTSPVLISRVDWNHLVLQVSEGKYSFNHRVKKRLASHCFLRQRSGSTKFPYGFSPLDVPSKKWLGVRASGSSGSFGAWVRGRLLGTPFISIYKVDEVSSFGALFFRIQRNAVFTDLISRSQDPLMWGEAGGLKIHWMDLQLRPFSILVWSRSRSAFFISLSLPRKLVPLSL